MPKGPVGGKLGNFDPGKMQAVSAAVAEEIEAAAWGHSSWTDVCERLSEAFPGSCCVMFSENPVDEILNHFSAHNVEQQQIDAYSEYFAFRNPWTDIFRHRPSEYIAVSEREYPARLLGKTEFYNDFVRKIPNFDASTGLNLNLGVSQAFRFPLHYSVASAPLYDAPAEFVMKGLVGPLKRSVNTMHTVQSKAETQIAVAALVDRRDAISFVVDPVMRLIDANDEALKALSDGGFLRSRQGRISFQDTVLTERVGACVRELASRPDSEVSAFSHGNDSGHWLIAFNRLPVLRFNPLLGGRQQILIQLRNIRPDRQRPPDLREFSRLFHLTPAEERLCIHLASGASLTEAAVALGITVETARFRIKSIFQKTGAHRQSALISMLRQF